jgi:hypothetical protein
MIGKKISPQRTKNLIVDFPSHLNCFTLNIGKTVLGIVSISFDRQHSFRYAFYHWQKRFVGAAWRCRVHLARGRQKMMDIFHVLLSVS